MRKLGISEIEDIALGAALFAYQKYLKAQK